jgi:hypothetical protein
MQKPAFFDSVTQFFKGYPVYSFHLNNLLQGSLKGTRMDQELSTVEEAFTNMISVTPVRVEVFLHPDYKDKPLDRRLAVACLPVYNDSLITWIPAFDLNGKELQVNARELPKDQVVLVVRIDEAPERSKVLTSNLYSKNHKALLQTEVSPTSSNFFLWWCTAQWYTTNKGDSWDQWPPEYYTKSWFCYNTSCTDFRGLQVSYMDANNGPEYWSPTMTSDADMQEHLFAHAHRCWSGDRGTRTKFRVEIWDRDYNEGSDDDFLDRFFPVVQSGWVQYDGPYNLDAEFATIDN